MSLDVRSLRTLAELRHAGSLTGAAERLHLTQSALSHQIKAVEDYVESSVYVRKSRPLRFTAAGQRLLTLADEVLPRVASAEQELRSMADGQTGRLHIAIECHSCFEWLMPTMDEYRRTWPEVQMDVSLGYSFEPLPALMRGDIDLVVTSDPKETPELAYEPLFGYQALLAMATDHRLAAQRWVEPADLVSETLITYPVERQRLDVFTHFLDPAQVAPVGVRTAELTIMALQLVASRRGVAALPNWALHEYLERGYVTARALGEHGMWGTLYAAVRSEDYTLPFVADFVQTARRISFKTLKGIQKPSP